MRLRILLLFTLFYCKSMLFSQTTVSNPSKSDFSGTLSFLASDWLEGRGATQKGGFMASEYIASMMGLYQLVPFQKDTASGYFQDFKILEHSVKNVSLEIKKGKKIIALSPETDFKVTPIAQSIQKEAQIVFVGYGINLSKEGYDDYKNQDVKNKVVVVLKGFPGHLDSTSVTYQKFKKIFPEENDLEETKLQTAINKGAIALVILDSKGKFKPNNSKEDAVFHSLENASNTSIPVFKLTKTASEKLLSETTISLNNIEKKLAQKNAGTSTLFKNTKINFSLELQSQTFPVRNVLGMIPGKDTTKTVIIGAHYDHLGIKNDSIYNGADDNASGTSGMLALAKKWSESKVKPPFNLLFASWTAEELGLLGSEYFVQNFDFQKQKILLAINMDMISRNAPEDQTHRILSIGTPKENENLKEIATLSNSKLAKPFTLDLWETDGHSGSDYASFTAKGIPIMTFFSGFHDDYHTPRDKASKVDLDKVKDVLFIVNTSLLKFIENQHN
ncbi:Zn-dependent M28 family amino/carboxypeptidase [Flavobacterium cutihirudinis]|uniref:Zn-dependent M28 family amino/carboxypeptidase n=1 Tax=Flavobacterium cutihirudinis TaxID=1265740 RepID=A0A3D9FSB9_9FLAO|nr:M20/M25/M40 family metallo-hydrolase [Flavobacterium cutihirudinis]RED23523.1 Zn-dependent M28 family amino/carboxypeptidase [Flavobacterium cutihirudinis]